MKKTFEAIAVGLIISIPFIVEIIKSIANEPQRNSRLVFNGRSDHHDGVVYRPSNCGAVMEAFLETTDWGQTATNHIYLLDGDRAIAYQNALDGTVKYFSKPIQINKRGRTFVKSKVNPFGKSTVKLIEIAGSKGATYFMNPVKKTCTCPGFSFRGNCKHLDKL